MARVAVFLNASAGTTTARDAAARLHEAFVARRLDARLVIAEPGADFTATIRQGLDGATIAVAAGGDGTINAVAAAIAGSSRRLGVIPLGTLNHFAKDLRIPLDVDQAVDAIAVGRTVNIDLADVNGRVFLNNSSIGIYPSLVHAREELRRQGHRKWPAVVLAAMRVLRSQHRLTVRVEASHETTVWRTPFLMVGNNAYDVTGLRVAGRTHFDRGQLFAYVAPRVRVRELPVTLVKEWVGRALHRKSRRGGAFTVISAAELWIDAPGPRAIDVALDGEVATLGLPLHYRSHPQALAVIVPAE